MTALPILAIRAIVYLGFAAGVSACTATVAGDPAFGSGTGAAIDPPSTGSTSGSASANSGGSTSGRAGSAGGNKSGAGSGESAGMSAGSYSGSASGAAAESGSESGRSSSGASSGSGRDAGTDSGAQGSASGSFAGSGSGSGIGGSGASPVDAGGGAMHRDAAVPVLTGCAAQVPSAVFAASCEGNACHNSKDTEYALDLQSPGVVSRLLNVPSLEVPRLKLIDPNAPDQSFILLKVKLAMPPAGLQMPQMGAKLSAAETQCFQQWVETVAAGPY